MLRKLNLPPSSFRITPAGDGQSSKIFDIIRKRFVVLTPEEWVRQHLIHFLVNDRKMPRGLVSVEKSLLVNSLPRRTDIVVYSRTTVPILLAECKAPEVPVNQAVFDQAARYNFTLGLKCFVLSNGLQTYCCVMDHELRQYRFLEEIPLYERLSDEL